MCAIAVASDSACARVMYAAVGEAGRKVRDVGSRAANTAVLTHAESTRTRVGRDAKSAAHDAMPKQQKTATHPCWLRDTMLMNGSNGLRYTDLLSQMALKGARVFESTKFAPKPCLNSRKVNDSTVAEAGQGESKVLYDPSINTIARNITSSARGNRGRRIAVLALGRTMSSGTRPIA